MTSLNYLIMRNTKLFFKDKGTFFTALIAPLVLLTLFITFLGNVYRENFHNAIPDGISVPDSLINGFVGGWLFSSLLAVCCVTIAFTANMIMPQDKMNGARADLTVTPVKGSVLGLGYYISTALITGIICYTAVAAGFIYLSVVGWYLSAADVWYVLLDVLLMVLFGTALSSVVCFFLKNQGGVTGVTTIVSAIYGFLCGAYMPISSFSSGVQSFIKYLPGTYGTVLLHNHLMSGTFRTLESEYFPKEAVDEIRKGFDNILYVGDKRVEIPEMYLILTLTIAALIALYVLLNVWKGKRAE